MNPPAGDVLWPRRALDHIRRQVIQGNEGIPFKYLVICVDNLDQCSPEVQQRAIVEVRDWINGSTAIRPYRVYIAVWPKTLEAILHTFGDPLPRNRYEEIEIHPLNVTEMNRSRNSAVRKDLEGMVEPSLESNLARRAKALASEPTNHKLSRYISNAAEDFSARCVPDIKRLSNGNLRSFLKCSFNMFRSKRLFETWSSRTTSSGRLSRYDLMEACLVGPNKYFQAEGSGIPNIFSISKEFPLLVIHLLSMLLLAPEVPANRVKNALLLLGYPDFSIEETLQAFAESDCQPFYLVRSSFNQNKYIVNQDSVAAILKLCSDAVYTDVMSVATPVTEQYRIRMHITSSTDPRDFAQRVSTSLAFIAFIDDAESRFLQGILDIKDRKRSEGIRDVLQYQVRLPMIAQRMRTGYLERIRGLKKAGYLAGLSDDWWSEIETQLSRGSGGLPEDPFWESIALIRSHKGS